jgi:hypothetical protein
MRRAGLFIAWLCIGSLLVTTGCGRSFLPGQGPVALSAAQHEQDAHVRLQWLGVSTWVLSRGRDVVVVDPFFTRPGLWTVLTSVLCRDFRYDEARIQAVLPRLPGGTRFVLIGHAHYDHLMDVPYYLRAAQPGVVFVGSRTARNILQGFSPPEMDFRVVDVPDRLGRSLTSGRVRVTPFLAGHAPHLFGITVMDGAVERPLASPPDDAWDYKLGDALLYFIDFLGDEDRVAARIFVIGAATEPEFVDRIGDDFLAQHPIDAAILCVPGWDKVSRYPESLLRRLNPATVVLSHEDDFFQPYLHGEDPRSDMAYVPFARFADFERELNRYAASRRPPMTVYAPKTGDTICLDC